MVKPKPKRVHSSQRGQSQEAKAVAADHDDAVAGGPSSDVEEEHKEEAGQPTRKSSRLAERKEEFELPDEKVAAAGGGGAMEEDENKESSLAAAAAPAAASNKKKPGSKKMAGPEVFKDPGGMEEVDTDAKAKRGRPRFDQSGWWGFKPVDDQTLSNRPPGTNKNILPTYRIKRGPDQEYILTQQWGPGNPEVAVLTKNPRSEIKFGPKGEIVIHHRP